MLGQNSGRVLELDGDGAAKQRGAENPVGCFGLKRQLQAPGQDRIAEPKYSRTQLCGHKRFIPGLGLLLVCYKACRSLMREEIGWGAITQHEL